MRGSLLDASAHGFQARHDCPSLAAGQVVVFQHALAAGRAQVVWTRIAGEQVQSGFRYLAV
ncbi:MAG: hypothetical protein C5B51_23505 [Terriglobia bacterium]|nr:MAG: hypothetical protein C5B51_23505 [Terriglobia bacterium]